MKILIIMGGFFPGKKYGGPPVSVDNFCSLMKDYTCKVVVTDHDMGDANRYEGILDGWNDRGNCEVQYLSDDRYNKKNFEKIIIEEEPDVLYLQGLFQSCILPCLKIAKKDGIKVLLAPRGELCKGALDIRKYKKAPYIQFVKTMGLVKNVHFQSTSDEETEAIKRWLKTGGERIHELDNIPSIPRKEYLHEKKNPGEASFIFLSRIHPKKNLQTAISYFLDVKGCVTFDIYGPMEDEEYWGKCQSEIERLPENVKVSYKGLVGHDQVHEVFHNYNAFLFPTFSENYGHVIAESLIVGTPVIISDQTPWTDVNENEAGWAIPLASKQSFVDKIQDIVNMDEATFDVLSKNALKYVSEKTRIDRLREKYDETFSRI